MCFVPASCCFIAEPPPPSQLRPRWAPQAVLDRPFPSLDPAQCLPRPHRTLACDRRATRAARCLCPTRLYNAFRRLPHVRARPGCSRPMGWWHAWPLERARVPSTTCIAHPRPGRRKGESVSAKPPPRTCARPDHRGQDGSAIGVCSRSVLARCCTLRTSYHPDLPWVEASAGMELLLPLHFPPVSPFPFGIGAVR